jgi:hypothetical protein
LFAPPKVHEEQKHKNRCPRGDKENTTTNYGIPRDFIVVLGGGPVEVKVAHFSSLVELTEIIRYRILIRIVKSGIKLGSPKDIITNDTVSHKLLINIGIQKFMPSSTSV